MLEYKNAVGKVLDFLDNNQYCTSVINGNRSCFKALESYLIKKNISYSSETADMWFESVQEKVSVTYRSFYRVLLHDFVMFMKLER